MKVLLVNGSPRPNGCTYTALNEITKVLSEESIDTEIVQLGATPIRDCTACRQCSNLGGHCIFNDDIVNELIDKARECDGFIFGTPVYYSHPTGKILSVLDRAFFAGKSAFQHKPGAAICSARRAGTTSSVDVLNKYFTICEMPVISSSYWNMVHGSNADDVAKDLEGLQTMRNLGRNMAWILKCIEAGRQSGIDIPKSESGTMTNFIR